MAKEREVTVRTGVPGFAPLASTNSRVLIVGSYPSPKSFDEGFYYGNPHNRFWPMMARLLDKEEPHNIAQKEKLITENGLALWDVLESCTIQGASDATITDIVMNDIAGFVKNHPIKAVFCNGAAAHKYYGKYCAGVGLPVYAMPSTSPANARFRMDDLVKEWQALLPLLV